MASIVGAPIDIVDPKGVWIDGTLDCEITDLCSGIGALPLGESTMRSRLSRQNIPGIDAGDVIETSGYPRAAGRDHFRTYRVGRDGRVIASVTITGAHDTPPVSWVARACKDTSLGQALIKADDVVPTPRGVKPPDGQ